MFILPEDQQSAEIMEMVSLDELCRMCRVQSHWIIELVAEGILEPEGNEKSTWLFTTKCISRTRIAWRLKEDLGVNEAGIAIVLELLDERESLQHRWSRTD
mgnify:CR=1 FL=1